MYLSSRNDAENRSYERWRELPGMFSDGVLGLKEHGAVVHLTVIMVLVQVLTAGVTRVISSVPEEKTIMSLYTLYVSTVDET